MFAARAPVRYSAILPAGVVPVGENEADSTEGCTRVLCSYERQVQFSPSHTQAHPQDLSVRDIPVQVAKSPHTSSLLGTKKKYYK